MIGTILFVAFMTILIKITDRNTSWWCGFFMIIVLFAKFGFELNMIGFVLAAGAWKLIKDVSNAM